MNPTKTASTRGLTPVSRFFFFLDCTSSLLNVRLSIVAVGTVAGAGAGAGAIVAIFANVDLVLLK